MNSEGASALGRGWFPRLLVWWCASTFAMLATARSLYSQASPLDAVQWQVGPSQANLGQWAKIEVPSGFLFANANDTRILMRELGNPPSGNELGFLAPEDLSWFIVFEFNNVGYVKDDEKDDLDPDALLETIRSGTEQANEERRKMGVPALHILGWELPPYYNDDTNNLEWALLGRDDAGQEVINHNVRLLGRRGVMEAVLVSDRDAIRGLVPRFQALLQGFEYREGQRYAQYTEGDRVAEYGLTALVAGGAAAVAVKSGLVKYVGKFLLAVVAGVGALAAKLAKRFRR